MNFGQKSTAIGRSMLMGAGLFYLVLPLIYCLPEAASYLSMLGRVVKESSTGAGGRVSNPGGPVVSADVGHPVADTSRVPDKPLETFQSAPLKKN